MDELESANKSVSFDCKGNRLLVKPIGNFTAAVVRSLQQRMKTEINREVTEVIFDFANVNHIDSSGIRLLIATYNTITKKSGAVRLVHLSKDNLQLFQSIRLDKLFNV